MSKEREIDDSELTEVSGAGEFVKPDVTGSDDDAELTKQPSSGGGGGSGPNAPDPVGGGGGGIQEPSWDD
jgi:hypothetical protein